MKNPIDAILKKKEALGDAMENAMGDLLATAYGALAEGASEREALKAIRATRLKHLPAQAETDLRKNAYAFAVTAKRKMPVLKEGDADGLALLPAWAYSCLFKRLHAQDAIHKRVIAPACNAYEAEAKREYLLKTIGSPLDEKTPLGKENTQGEEQNASTGLQTRSSGSDAEASKLNIFFLASTHDDSAEDHADAQGCIYYDRFWRGKLAKAGGSKRLAKDINIFISKHALKSVQWVINSPVWLVTRPNCRHFFKAISVQEAFEAQGDAETLLARYGMHTHEGGRGNRQTLYHSTRGEWYTRTHVDGIIKQYEKRVALLKKLQAEAPAPDIETDLEKAKLLLKKWRAFRKNNLNKSRNAL